MVLRYPLAIVIGFVLTVFVIIISFLFKIKKPKYKKGKMIANTSYIKSTDYYKSKLRQYKLFLTGIRVLCVISMIVSSFMFARLTEVQSNDKYLYNRDIYLCMDVSSSVNDLNDEMIANMKDLVSSLSGERFGIVIFNTSAVTLVPLTDDYNYVNDTLDKLTKSIHALDSYNIFNFNYSDYFYIVNGTIEGSSEYGSSLIGDGLASCSLAFGDTSEDRTRIIVFTTDNDLYGKPIYTLDEASDLAKKKNILVYAVGTENIYTSNKSALRNAALNTGGKYYEQGDNDIKDVVQDINKTTKTKIEIKGNTTYVDSPLIPFIVLLVSVILFIILSRGVIL